MVVEEVDAAEASVVDETFKEVQEIRLRVCEREFERFSDKSRSAQPASSLDHRQLSNLSIFTMESR